MNEQIVRKSLCWGCVNKEYDSKFSPNGKYYQDWNCFFPQHRHRFGQVKSVNECEDFEDEAAVDARLMGGL